MDHKQHHYSGWRAPARYNYLQVLTRLPESHLFNTLALELRIHLLNSIATWLEDCREKLYKPD
jgi:hypothetical protein